MRPVHVVAVVVAVGCQGQGTANDQARLSALLSADMRVSTILRRADEHAVKGRAKEALEVLRREALPLAEKNAADLARASFASPWGNDRAREVRALFADRHASIESYSRALDSDDIAQVIQSMESQKSLEERAQSLAGAIRAPR